MIDLFAKQIWLSRGHSFVALPAVGRGASDIVVVPTEGKDVDGFVVELIDDPVPSGQASGPETGEVVSQGFRSAGSHRGVVTADEFADDLPGGLVQFAVFSAHGFIRLPGSALKYQ